MAIMIVSSCCGTHLLELQTNNLTEEGDLKGNIFGANYPRLQELKAKYDPDSLFNKLFSIVPKPAATP